jgi:hypothetical protein
VCDQLLDAGISCTVLKGVATAHLDYADPSMRQFGDVDLLVAPSEFARAGSILDLHGASRPYALPSGHERFTHAVTFRSPGQVEVDLHQHIAHRALGQLIPTDALLARRVPFGLAGRTLHALHRHDRLIHASVHTFASRDSYRRLSSLADVLLLAESMAGEAPEVLACADRWRVR